MACLGNSQQMTKTKGAGLAEMSLVRDAHSNI
jgi:hypothetical protein